MSLRGFLGLAMLATLIGFISCERDDDEPIVNRDFSRLYMSFSEYDNSSQPIKPVNVGVLARADSTNFDDQRNFQSFISATNGASAITFNPSAQRIFVASSNIRGRDSTIQIFTVAKEGTVANSGEIENKHIISVTGLLYYPSLDNLYAVEYTKNTIIVYNRPKGRNGRMNASHRFIIPDDKNLKPWDIAMYKNVVYVTRTGANGGIDVFENIASVRQDTLTEDVKPQKQLRLTGSHNIKGISLDTVNNMLALTDYSGTGDAAVGRILIFDNFNAMLEAGGEMTPSRIITGPNTGLRQPSDVELDFKAGSKYLYVSDPQSKSVYRFLKTADGDEKPESTFRLGENSSPVGLSLDSR